MSNKEHLFNEVIECFKVINTCLRCIYNSETHMYRPLSAQLRILFCDKNRNKDNAVLTGLFPNIRLSPLKSLFPIEPGKFEKEMTIMNSIKAATSEDNLIPKFHVMPFEILQFNNGLEISNILLDKDAEPIAMEQWLNQIISTYPNTITVKQLIKTVSDKAGGAHIDREPDELLNSLAKNTPCTIGIEALLTIGFARVAQQLGWVVTEFYDKYGVNGHSEEFENIFQKMHFPTANEAKVDNNLYKMGYSEFYLVAVEVSRKEL